MVEALDNPHPRVKAWLAEHKREQEKRAREIKAQRGEHWGPGPLRDLTKRDLYRFNATSLIFREVEKASGAVLQSPISGKITFGVSGEKVDCSIVEKLFKPVKADDTWTAYPEHHQTGLQSSGFLRISITSWYSDKTQWVETKDKPVAVLLPEIVQGLFSAARRITQTNKEHEEAARRRREEETRRYERERAREIDDQRWARFCAHASNMDQRLKLAGFVAEIRRRADADSVVIPEGCDVEQLLQWAEKRMAELDPFVGGVGGLITSVLGKSV